MESGKSPDAPWGDGPPPRVLKVGAVIIQVFIIGFGLLWLSGVAGIGSFVVRHIVTELRKPLVFRPVEAAVTAYTPPATTVDEFDKEDRTEGEIVYAYTVGSGQHQGKHTQTDRPLNEYDAALAGPHRPGEKIAAWYDPDEPSRSTLVPVASPTMLGFLMFLMPFLAVGGGMIWAGLVGAPAFLKLARSSRGDRLRRAAAGPFIASYSLFSCVGAFVFIVASDFLDWRTGWIVGLALIVVVFPLAAWLVGRRAAHRHERMRQPADAIAPGEETGDRDRPAPPTGPRSLADQADTQDEEPRHAGAAPSPGGASPIKKVGGLVAMTLFWCGITGVFVGFVAYSFLKSAEVRARFRSVEGTVVASKVERHSGDDGDTFSPLIKYRYTVGGREHTCTRYAFDMWSFSETGWAQEIVNAHPPGKRVTVYYDPDDPAEAVLSSQVPELLYFLVLFLQPFVVVGLGMIGCTVTFPARHRRLRRFLEADPQTPWNIPTWGTLRREMGALSIRSRGYAPLLVGAMGYGLTCFLGTFATAGLCFGLHWPFRPVVVGFLAAGAAIGLMAAAVSWLRRGRTRLEIDQGLGRLTLVTYKRRVESGLSEVASWRVRGVPNPHNVRSEGDNSRAPLLAAVRTDGSEIPVHVFAANSDGQAIADRAAAGLAELTGKPVPPADRRDQDATKEASILEAIRVAYKDQKRARREYADLT